MTVHAKRVTALALTASSAVTALALAPAAHASEQQLISSGSRNVCEHNYDVKTGSEVRPGDRVVISATGTIWAGWWFIGRNGPQGLWFNGEYDYPSPNNPADSLLFKVGANYQFAGTGTDFRSPDPAGVLSFRINDNVPGNGNGCFSVTYKIYR